MDAPGPVDDAPTRLLREADEARAANRAAEAVAPLRRLVAEHPGDPRASLAAFTLGRVLLEGLARPAEAADAFLEVRRLAPRSVLAEDALAREVEARHAAGQHERARALAAEYEALYPTGSRLEQVKGTVR